MAINDYSKKTFLDTPIWLMINDVKYIDAIDYTPTWHGLGVKWGFDFDNPNLIHLGEVYSDEYSLDIDTVSLTEKEVNDYINNVDDDEWYYNSEYNDFNDKIDFKFTEIKSNIIKFSSFDFFHEDHIAISLARNGFLKKECWILENIKNPFSIVIQLIMNKEMDISVDDENESIWFDTAIRFDAYIQFQEETDAMGYRLMWE
jgi:hypothetical protein